MLAQRPADGRRDDILAARVGSRSLEGETLTLQRVRGYVDYTQNEVILTELEEIPSSLFTVSRRIPSPCSRGVTVWTTDSYRENWWIGAWTGTEETP